MSSQMSSGASAPILVPSPGTPPSAPTLVPPRRKPSGKKRLGWIILLIVAAIGVERGVHYYTNVRTTPEAAAAAVIRTGTVTQGLLQRTIRLTGTTGAERFASLISPQLRGNRSGSGRGGSFRNGGGGGGGGSTVLSRIGCAVVGCRRRAVLRFFDHRPRSQGSAATTPSVASHRTVCSGGRLAGIPVPRPLVLTAIARRRLRSSTPGSNSSNSSSSTLLPSNPSSSSTASPSSTNSLGSTSGSLQRLREFQWRRWRRRWRCWRWR